MLSRRAILALLLLLPLAAPARTSASTSQKRHHQSTEVTSEDPGAKRAASKKSQASKPSKSTGAAKTAETSKPGKNTTSTAKAKKRSRGPEVKTASKTSKHSRSSKTARRSRSPEEPAVAEKKPERKTQTAKSHASTPEPRVISKPSHDEPTVVTRGSSAASKLSSRAIDAIPAAESSLYDRHNAQPANGSIFTKWFGPKANGMHYDSRMIQAAKIAEARARQHSVRACWRYVKEALLAANVVDTYPQTALAKQAGDELTRKHGFKQLSISDPYKAPVGSVIVYGGKGAGHVEIRTAGGFVSDFESPTPSKRPLLGVFIKPS